MGNEEPEVGRKPAEFGAPVAQERGRQNQNAGGGLPGICRRFRGRWRGGGFGGAGFEEAEKGNDLQGFAKAHVVGQTGTEAESGEGVEPCHTALLVGTEGGL